MNALRLAELTPNPTRDLTTIRTLKVLAAANSDEDWRAFLHEELHRHAEREVRRTRLAEAFIPEDPQGIEPVAAAPFDLSQARVFPIIRREGEFHRLLRQTWGEYRGAIIVIAVAALVTIIQPLAVMP